MVYIKIKSEPNEKLKTFGKRKTGGRKKNTTTDNNCVGAQLLGHD
jgi:hypothetical protein